MNIVFAGGGTAGHITPSLSVADRIKELSPECKVFFIGRCDGAENSAITDSGYPLYTVDAKSFPRRISLSELRKIKHLFSAPREAYDILKRLSADAVFATGGYVSWPVLRAAEKMNIPRFLHESNSFPGMVTRMCAEKCTRLYLGMPSDHPKIQCLKNTLLTGNPIRADFGKASYTEARERLGIDKNKKLIISVGGSLGAEEMNRAVFSLMHDFSSRRPDVVHIHSTGVRYYDTACLREPLFTRGTLGCKILSYIHDMPTYLSAADLVISRGGAITLSEIAASKTPAVIIPSPNVTDNHQYKNALVYKNIRSAVILQEQDLKDGALTVCVKKLINSPRLLLDMKSAYAMLDLNFAADKIARDMLSLIPTG